MRENQFLTWLRQQNSQSSALVHGIGDDAAVLAPNKTNMVVTTDLICDGTHFLSSECSPTAIGRKAMAVNLSDVAAMAANPVAAFVSLLLPTDCSDEYAKHLFQGAAELGKQFDCVIAGGDTNAWAGKLAINVLVIGEATSRGPLLRSGAEPDDVILVTGALGGSIKGHHLDFTPRVAEALYLHEHFDIHAMMDLSDGLAMDLQRMCTASNCGAEVTSHQVPISEAAQSTAADARQRLLHAIGDGEDFELLFAASTATAEQIIREQPLSTHVSAVGKFTKQTALWLIDDDGRQPFPNVGFEHGVG